MIKPQPFKLICKRCGWRKTFAPQSDALVEGSDYLSCCPKCGNSELEHEAAGTVTGLLAELSKKINRQ